MSVMFTLHQYFVLACVKFVLVCVMFSPGVMLVLVGANCFHGPLVLLYQLAVRLSPVSWSLAITWSVGVSQLLVSPSLGFSPVCVGALFVVKW